MLIGPTGVDQVMGGRTSFFSVCHPLPSLKVTEADRMVLAERHHGRRYLLDQLIADPSNGKRRIKPKTGQGGVLALGYEILEVRDDGDESADSFWRDERVLIVRSRLGPANIDILPSFITSFIVNASASCITP